MTGAALTDAIMQVAHPCGWLGVHFRPARTTKGWRTAGQYDATGWPDLVLVRDRLIVVEVKGDGDRLRPEQTVWLERLAAAGVETHLWTSADWFDGSVDRILARAITPGVRNEAEA